MAEKRARIWTFLVYPESAPEDWINKLSQYHVPWCYSPLHNPLNNDKSIVEDDSENKVHYHCMFAFEGVKSQSQVNEIAKSVNGTIATEVQSKRGMFRYFAHIDQPLKEQFESGIDSITPLCGFDVDAICKPSSREKLESVKEMMQWVDDNNITEFAQLARYAARERGEDWLPLLCTNVDYFLDKVITSQRFTIRRETKNMGNASSAH